MVVEVQVFSLFKNSHFRTIIVARSLPCGVGHVGQCSNWAFRAQRESNRYTMNFKNKFSSLVVESGSRDVCPLGRQLGKIVKKDDLPPTPPSDDRSYGSIPCSGSILKEFEDFSMSMSMMSVVGSERARLGYVPAGDRTTPPQATDVSRIVMRLLRDTRSVLEYLSKTIIG